MRLFNFMGPLRFLFLLDRQQRIDILLDGLHFPELLLGCVISCVQSVLSGCQFRKLSLHTIRRGNGNGAHIGAGLALKNGSKIVRPVILVVLALLAVKVFLEFFGIA